MNYLLIVNPLSGKKTILKHLDDIEKIFSEKGIVTKTVITTKEKEAIEIAKNNAGKYDAIICAGGDGTYNETISGVIESKEKVNVGYIPCGSTNDFAESLGLSTNNLLAANDIANGRPYPFDTGSFNGRTFAYVASCGAFTEASYDTPQKLKNRIGHLAYVLNGATKLGTIKPNHIYVKVDNKEEYEGDYIFCSFSNSKSLAGLVKLKSKSIDLSDGKLELALVKAPSEPLGFFSILKMIFTHNIDKSGLITFVKGKEFLVKTSKDVDWTLDGECEKGCEEIKVVTLHNSISLIKK